MFDSNTTLKKSWSGPLALMLVVLILVFLPGVSVFSQTAPSSFNDYDIKRREYIQLLSNVFDFVHRNYVDEVDPEILYQGAMEGLMNAFGDPYTTYMDLSLSRSISDTTSGNFGGVGLTITKAIESSADNPAYVEVSYPMEGTPVYSRGIKLLKLTVWILLPLPWTKC